MNLLHDSAARYIVVARSLKQRSLIYTRARLGWLYQLGMHQMHEQHCMISSQPQHFQLQWDGMHPKTDTRHDLHKEFGKADM